MNAVFAFLGALLVSGHDVREEPVVKNIALGQSVTYCGNDTGFGFLVNGIINELPEDVMIIECYQPAYIEINLKNEYYVNYIIIYEGNNTDRNSNQLDYFDVMLTGDDEMFMCSSYPKRASMGRDENGKFIINCFQRLAGYIMLKSRTSRTLFINEIEAYTYADNFGENMLIYRGCFSSFRSFLLDKNPLSCRGPCSTRFPYLAISKNIGCACGLYVGEDERPRTQCNQKCGPHKLECGGTGVYSIFIVRLELPYYQGCFNIISDRKTITMEKDMTIAKCLKHCEDDYFALLTSGVTCSCQGNTFLRNITSSYVSCEILCPDGESFCGGKDYSAVYKTCSPSCSPLFQCSEWDELGICQVSCVNRHAGLHCVRKVDPVNFTLADETTTSMRIRIFNLDFMPCDPQGKCPLDPNAVCEEIKRGYWGCACRRGYKMFGKRFCLDIDECGKRPCNNASRCINTDGSYDCRCRAGAIRVKGVCEYVDKCNDMVLCDQRTTLCVNEGYSYKCLCKDGFKKVDRFKCEDIDECKSDDAVCSDNSRCLNIKGVYRCHCNEGLRMVKTHYIAVCQDIDECNIPNQFPCNESSEVCINIFASYVCQCSAGFVKVAKNCEVIGESSTREDIYILPVRTVDEGKFEPRPSESTMYSVVGSLVFFCFAFLVYLAFRLRSLIESPLPEFDENDIDLIRTHLPELFEVYREERRRSSRNRD